MRLARLDAREDRRVLEAGGVVAQIGARVEHGAKLRESPAFDEAHFRLRDVAARQLVEQIHRRERRHDQVVTGLDVALAAQDARQRLEVIRPHLHAGALELGHGGAKAGARRDFDFGGQLGDFQRRSDVPGGVTTGAEHGEQDKREKSFQVCAR